MNILKFGMGGWRSRYWYRNIPQFFRNLRYAWQRITRGYADCDLWGLGDYWLELMAESLGDFANMTVTYPNKYYERYGEKGMEM